MDTVGSEQSWEEVQKAAEQGTRYAVLQWAYAAIERLPADNTGVYAFWCPDTGKCIYVGRTKSRGLRERVREHWTLNTNRILRLWIRAFGEYLALCYHTCSPSRAERLEARLIQKWQPEANIAGKATEEGFDQ